MRRASTTAQAVLRFLESVGRPAEAELYLRLFRKLPKESFAILAIEASAFRGSPGAVVDQIGYLHQLGLVTPVALGLFDPAAADPGAERLVRRLPRFGGEPVVHDAATPKLAGTVRADLRAGRTPILKFGAPTIDERFDALGELASALGSRKVVLVRERGALGPRGNGRVNIAPGHEIVARDGGLSLISIRSDFEALLASGLLDEEELVVLEQVRRVLERASGTLVSVTSPMHVLDELFTVKGRGTLVKIGAQVERHESFDTLDRDNLERLLTASFGRELVPHFFDEKPIAVYVADEYRGAAVLVPAPTSPYLTKFAVDPIAHGEGLARDLWEAMTRDHPALFWRARPDNPIRGWYSDLADALVRAPEWHVYLRGIEPSVLSATVEWALARPVDFIEPTRH